MKPFIIAIAMSLIIKGIAFSQSPSATYIWNNYQSSAQEISSINPDDLDYDGRPYYWAVTSIIRANFNTSQYERSEYLFNQHLKPVVDLKDPSRGFIDFDTYIEVMCVGALVQTKLNKFSESLIYYEQIESDIDQYYSEIRSVESAGSYNFTDQLSLIYLNKAKAYQSLANKDSATFYFNKAVTSGYGRERTDIYFDALTNNAIHQIRYEKDFKRGSDLIQEAESLNLNSTNSRILLAYSKAVYEGEALHNYDDAIDRLLEARALAAGVGEFELYKNMAGLIMSFETDQQLHEQEKRQEIFNFLQYVFVFTVIFALNWKYISWLGKRLYRFMDGRSFQKLDHNDMLDNL